MITTITIIKTYSESWVTVELRRLSQSSCFPCPTMLVDTLFPMISFWQHCQNTLLLCHHGGLEVSVIVKLNSLIAIVSPSNLELSKREQSASCSFLISCTSADIPGGAAVKNPPVSAGDRRDSGSIAGSRRIPGGGHGHALQRSCLEKPWKKRAWRVLGHWVAKSRTQLKQLSRHARWNFLGVCFSLRVNWLMSVFHKHVLFFSISCLGSLVSRGSI